VRAMIFSFMRLRCINLHERQPGLFDTPESPD